MSYFLDTNIILFLFRLVEKPFTSEVEEILKNPKNKFFSSTISLNEIVQLSRKRRISGIDQEKHNTPKKVLEYILRKLNGFVVFLPYEAKTAKVVAGLSFKQRHNDPNDLAIIAHAISKRMVVISSDKDFPYYTKQGLSLISNVQRRKGK